MGGLMQVLTTLARGSGYTLGELSLEMEARRYYAPGHATQIFEGQVASCPMFAPLVGEILGLNEAEERVLHNAVMTDGYIRYRRVTDALAPYSDAV